ncbi:amino acid aminotransferase [Sphingobacterium faecium]|uniref:amino acid aminotransferase n=1 Tax=Sphingobacterium faecium TaxID=34087 RepID=UPI002468C7F2|nr:amino acid aminotransferase [Sphingobacterium faecium]MDH5826282.1 aspartate/tyrosine/aromatic aminotransferase [Sphingobacterium faecium]
MFNHIENYAGDPILSLMESFNNDARFEKVNLSIGLYSDENGVTPIMDAVAKAKLVLKALNNSPSLYLPMSGMPSYVKQVQQLLFESTPSAQAQNKIATIQTLGGSGALKIGADFLKKSYPNSKLYVSDPTWDNHIAIFTGAGLEVAYYPYFNKSTGTVDFKNMIDFLETLDEKSIVLLHPCCHNPTGADLSNVQWDVVIRVLKEKNLIPFLDLAYLGFGDGFEEDAYAIKSMTQSGLSFLLSNSFSKIFSLYGERVGALSIICGSEQEANLVLGQLKATVRKNYSSPPTYGAQLIDVVLSNIELKRNWLDELECMRTRMNTMRTALYAQLIKIGADKNKFKFLIEQKGMFSYTGFTSQQVKTLREEFAIYLVASGRICLAGLNRNNIKRVAEAFLTLTEKTNTVSI